MKVILKEDIPTLGKAGDLVEVARGYGRNYLLPQGLALEATPQHQRQLEEQKRIILKRKAKDLEEARSLAGKFEGLTLELARKVVEEGKLYGSVSAKDLLEKLAEQNITLDRKKIFLKEPIRTLGDFEVPIRLDAEITATLKVSVVEDK
jgi:large subunit ribosomal protein L9